MLRILIADDSDLVRNGIRNLLGDNPDLQICGECADGNDAVHKVEELQPDVLLLDMSIPGLRGHEVIQALQNKGLQTRVIIVSQHDKNLLDHLARGFGVANAISKSQLASDLIPALSSLSDRTTKYAD